MPECSDKMKKKHEKYADESVFEKEPLEEFSGEPAEDEEEKREAEDWDEDY